MRHAAFALTLPGPPCYNGCAFRQFFSADMVEWQTPGT